MEDQYKEKVRIITDERSSSARPLRIYSESFKLKVVKELISDKFSNKETARKYYGIKSKSAILDWMRLYSGAEGIDKTGRLLKKRDSMSEEIAKQSMRIKELELALRTEKLKVDLGNAFIDIAKSSYGIDLRKKHGAKPFSKSKQNEQKK